MTECQAGITATLDPFAPSKRTKVFNNVSIVPTSTPFQLRVTPKVIDKVKMPRTESLLPSAVYKDPAALNGND